MLTMTRSVGSWHIYDIKWEAEHQRSLWMVAAGVPGLVRDVLEHCFMWKQ